MNTDDWQVRLIQLIAIPGLLLSYYMLLYHNGDLIASCGVSSWEDCGAVSGPNAAYSSIGPVPVALIGLLGYLFIFGIIWLRDWFDAVDANLPEILVATTGLAFLFSLYLTYLEAFVIDAFCRFCIISAVMATVLLGLAGGYLVHVNRSAAAGD